MEKISEKKQIIYYINKFKLRGVIKEKFLERVELHRYSKGEVIYYMEDEFRYLYFLVDGMVLVHLNTFEGKEMYLDFGKPLDIMGDLEFINSTGIYSNVEAVRDTSLLALPRDCLKENARENYLFYEMISRYLGEKLRKTSQKYTEMILYPLKNRVATYLYMVAGDEGVIEGFRQSDVALSYGISDRHLRRLLGELEDEGIISKRRGYIEVVDRKKLKDYCIE